MFAGRPGFNPRLSHTKASKMLLDAALLNTQRYKGKDQGQSRAIQRMELCSHLDVVAIEKKAFGSPSTKGVNFTYFYIK